MTVPSASSRETKCPAFTQLTIVVRGMSKAFEVFPIVSQSLGLMSFVAI